jgi:putative membrane protein
MAGRETPPHPPAGPSHAVSRSALPAAAAAVLILVLAASGVRPYDRLTWFLEVLPILVVLPVLFWTRRSYPLTGLLYALIFLHALILIAGGHWTYARVPLGFRLEELLSLHRNPYDKIGHFAQGFVPAIAAREILIRGGYVRGRKMLAFVVLSIVLAISASYELFEWGAALALGKGADDFLGTQGDPWDTQSDMFFALVGGSLALLILSRIHDRAIGALHPAPVGPS